MRKEGIHRGTEGFHGPRGLLGYQASRTHPVGDHGGHCDARTGWRLAHAHWQGRFTLCSGKSRCSPFINGGVLAAGAGVVVVVTDVGVGWGRHGTGGCVGPRTGPLGVLSPGPPSAIFQFDSWCRWSFRIPAGISQLLFGSDLGSHWVSWDRVTIWQDGRASLGHRRVPWAPKHGVSRKFTDL